MTFLDILRLAAPPLIGAVIGLITNYIAVKMLFRPLTPKHIGKWRIPFTPGIVPRRQGALARAMGKMVSDSLVREEELAAILLTDDFLGFVARGVLSVPSLRDGAELLLDGHYGEKRDPLLDGVTDKISEGLRQMDIAGLIVAEGRNAAAEMGAHNPLVKMFLTDSKIDALAGPVGERVEAFIEGDGRAQLREALGRELEALEARSIADLLGIDVAEALIANACRRLLTPHLTEIAAQFHIAETVEEKVNAMPARDLEKLLLSIMKKELRAVIWLGGIIGFLLGLINLFLQL